MLWFCSKLYSKNTCIFPKFANFRIHFIQNVSGLSKKSYLIANETQLLNMRHKNSENVFILFICKLDCKRDCFKINMNIMGIFLLFLFFISNYYFKYQILNSLILFQNPITEIKFCSKMVAEINIQSYEWMVIDTDNTISIFPWCWSRCSHYSWGWEARAVQEQFSAVSGLTADPWGYLWPITSALLFSVNSHHAQNRYFKMILCAHGQCRLH